MKFSTTFTFAAMTLMSSGTEARIGCETTCTMPLWMAEPLKTLALPEVFRSDPTDFLPDQSLFEIVEPGSDDYCKAFHVVDATDDCPQSTSCPGASLFAHTGL